MGGWGRRPDGEGRGVLGRGWVAKGSRHRQQGGCLVRRLDRLADAAAAVGRRASKAALGARRGGGGAARGCRAELAGPHGGLPELRGAEARLARLAPLARGQGLPRRPLAGHQGGARRDQPLRGRRLRPLAARRRGARHSAALSADRYVVRRRHARAVLHGTLDASSRRLQQVPVARLRSARVAAAVGRLAGEADRPLQLHVDRRGLARLPRRDPDHARDHGAARL
mmetsp:Transcript_475/g.1616  ORF Transcript_475/g.1616 Transcript_475/m.1616 type:complete len:226 (-) Transcript_475:607-1284(-)